MGLSESFLPEFDREMAGTRKTLERVPDGKWDWKPHEKSAAMGELAAHLTNLAIWTVYVVEKDSVDLLPDGKPLPGAEQAKSQGELLVLFDDNVKKARTAIAAASDGDLSKSWTLIANGKTLRTMPKMGALRGFIMNHMIHHRAQMGVYLRLNDLPVPSIYGPSADEG